jgi:hypothetical protein
MKWQGERTLLAHPSLSWSKPHPFPCAKTRLGCADTPARWRSQRSSMVRSGGAKPHELFSLRGGGISEPSPPLGRWMDTGSEEFRRRRKPRLFLLRSRAAAIATQAGV